MALLSRTRASANELGDHAARLKQYESSRNAFSIQDQQAISDAVIDFVMETVEVPKHRRSCAADTTATYNEQLSECASRK